MLETLKPPAQEITEAPKLTKVNLFKLFIFNGAAVNADDRRIVYDSAYYKETCKELGIEAKAYYCSHLKFIESFSSFERLEIFDFLTKYNEAYKDVKSLEATCAVIRAFQLFLKQDAFALINLIMPALQNYFFNKNSYSSNDKSIYWNDPIFKEIEDTLETVIEIKNTSAALSKEELEAIRLSIKSAYNKFSLKWHPDRNKAAEATWKFQSGSTVYNKWNAKVLRVSEVTKLDKFKHALEYFNSAIFTQYQQLVAIFGEALSRVRTQEAAFKTMHRQSRVEKSYSEIEALLLEFDDKKIAELKDKHRHDLKEERVKQILRLALVYYRVGFVIKCLTMDNYPGIALLTAITAALPIANTLSSYRNNDHIKHTPLNLLFDSALDTNKSLWLTGLASFVYTLKYAQLSTFRPDFLHLTRRALRRGWGDAVLSTLFNILFSFTYSNNSLLLLLKTPLFMEAAAISAYTAYTTYRYGWNNADIGYFLFRGSDNECIVSTAKEAKDLLPGLRVIANPERFTKPMFEISNAFCSVLAASCIILESNYYKNQFLSADITKVTSYAITNPITSGVTVLFASAIYFGPQKILRHIAQNNMLEQSDTNRAFEAVKGLQSLVLPFLSLVILKYSRYLHYTVQYGDCGIFNLSGLPLSAKITGIGIASNILLFAATHCLALKPRSWEASVEALTGSFITANTLATMN